MPPNFPSSMDARRLNRLSISPRSSTVAPTSASPSKYQEVSRQSSSLARHKLIAALVTLPRSLRPSTSEMKAHAPKPGREIAFARLCRGSGIIWAPPSPKCPPPIHSQIPMQTLLKNTYVFPINWPIFLCLILLHSSLPTLTPLIAK